MTFAGDNKKIVNAYILPLIKDNGKKLTKIIMYMREKVPFNTIWKIDLDFYGKIYDLGELKMLASKFQDDQSLTSEEREALKLLIDTPYETDEVTIKKQNTENKKVSGPPKKGKGSSPP